MATAPEGDLGLAAAPDGRVVYTRGGDLWIAGPDGSNPRQLTRSNGRVHLNPAISPDGSMLAFIETTGVGLSTARLMSMPLTGATHPVELAGNASTAVFTPDGQFIVFSGHDASEVPRAMKVSVRGGTPTLVRENCYANDLDRTGERLLCCDRKSEEYVVDLKTGREVWRGNIPARYPVRWWDENNIAYVFMHQDDVGNVWLQPLDKAEPHRLTSFSSAHMPRFAFTPDKQRMYFSRRHVSRDAVLIRNLPIPDANPLTALLRRLGGRMDSNSQAPGHAETQNR
jgi:Tol biopolymer transport system component